jgi:endonuclease/exonuclease/phosphatase family metal-dependent hydrolase
MKEPLMTSASPAASRGCSDPTGIGKLIEKQVASITEMDISAREEVRAGPQDSRTHRRYFSQVPALQEIELGGAGPVHERTNGPVRVAVWNVERLRHVETIAEMLSRQRPDITLLSEVDKGMARSGNRHCLAELAGKLGHQFAYGVEFVELGLGDEHEGFANSGQSNLVGFHGNAVTSAIRFHRPFIVRLEAEGGWFGPARGQPRIGGRMAIGAQIEFAGRRVTFVSVHLESHSNPDQRLKQTCHLLDMIEHYDAGAPLLIGGDFNTSTIDRTRDRDQEFQELAADPTRLLDVAPYEPLFRELANHGFDWHASNVPGKPTERTQPGRPARPLGKIDWIFTRGLRVTAPAILPALAMDGTTVSDHDCLLVTVEADW